MAELPFDIAVEIELVAEVPSTASGVPPVAMRPVTELLPDS